MQTSLLVLAVLGLTALALGAPDDATPKAGEEKPAGEAGKPGRRGRPGRMGGPKRGPGGFRQMIECCESYPKLLDPETMKACKAQGKAEGKPADKPADKPEDKPEDKPAGKEGGNPPHRGPHGRHGPHGHPGSCFMECAFKANNLTTTAADGSVTVDIQALNSRLTSFATGKWEQPIKDAQAECVKETAAAPEDKRKCKSGAGKIAHCLMHQLLPKCPDWSSSEKCAALKPGSEA